MHDPVDAWALAATNQRLEVDSGLIPAFVLLVSLLVLPDPRGAPVADSGEKGSSARVGASGSCGRVVPQDQCRSGAALRSPRRPQSAVSLRPNAGSTSWEGLPFRGSARERLAVGDSGAARGRPRGRKFSS